MTARRSVLVLYFERPIGRATQGTNVSSSDEEDCYTAAGVTRGVYLSTERPRSPNVLSCEVSDVVVVDYEVTADGARHRSFVVPATITADLVFT